MVGIFTFESDYNRIFAHMYSLYGNEIDDAHSLAEGLQHCTNLQKLK